MSAQWSLQRSFGSEAEAFSHNLVRFAKFRPGYEVMECFRDVEVEAANFGFAVDVAPEAYGESVEEEV